MSASFLKNRINRNLKKATKVHPCIINNHRALVHEYGLQENNPEAYEQLKAYAQQNSFGIKEEQRVKDSKPMNFERRLAKSLPMLFLASGIFPTKHKDVRNRTCVVSESNSQSPY